jgi:hypothetical protein
MARGYRKWMVGALGVSALGVSVLAIPSAAATAPPVPVVPGCEQGCDTVFSVPLPHGARLDGLRSQAGSLLAYWTGDTLSDSTAVRGSDGFPYERVNSASCAENQCSVSFGYGAHSSAVAAVSLDSRIDVTDTVEGLDADTRDLNGDGRPDAALRQSTYYPNFAQAPLYWETYVTHNGRFTRTGCTVPTTRPGPAPATAVSGSCT